MTAKCRCPTHCSYSSFEHEWPVCSGCRRWPLAAVLTLTGIKQSLGPAIGGSSKGCCRRYCGRRALMSRSRPYQRPLLYCSNWKYRPLCAGRNYAQMAGAAILKSRVFAASKEVPKPSSKSESATVLVRACRPPTTTTGRRKAPVIGPERYAEPARWSSQKPDHLTENLLCAVACRFSFSSPAPMPEHATRLCPSTPTRILTARIGASAGRPAAGFESDPSPRLPL